MNIQQDFKDVIIRTKPVSNNNLKNPKELNRALRLGMTEAQKKEVKAVHRFS
jgi:hypothetical protein